MANSSGCDLAHLLNHVRSCWLKNKGLPICSKLTGDLPHGPSPTTIPRGAVQVQVNVPNHVWSHQLKNEGWPICLKLTGDLPHSRGCRPPWRQQVPTTIPRGAVQVQVNVPNHVWSCRPLMMHHPGQDKAGRTLVSTLPLKNLTQADLP